MYEGPRVLTLREAEVPVPAEDEVLIRVERAGICGSELSGYLGHNSLRKPPLVMGHEFAGTVEAAGARAGRFRSGDRVTANPLVSCGRCRACLAGDGQLCPQRVLVGAGRPGAYAEYVAVPERNVYRLPDGMGMAEGALVEPLACAVHIGRLASLAPWDRLFIAGAGPIGLLVLAAARRFGLTDIVVMDINRSRLDIVRELGGQAAANPEELRRLVPDGGFDAAVDAVGLEATRRACMEAVRPGGRIVLSGLHAADSSLPVNLAIRSELTLLGAFAYRPLDFELALDWLAQGLVDLSPWTETAPLEEGQACFEKLLSDPGRTAKILLSV
ncbi:galactitol-1-phosphate 5-dehydrogenase [Paenibacillus sp. J31TS4]|nr:galactitol-1-phosphate 5-dehydrogenase [Paenibacillus sp. J31TS4]